MSYFLGNSLIDRLLGPSTAMPQAAGSISMFIRPSWSDPADATDRGIFAANKTPPTGLNLLQILKTSAHNMYGGWYPNSDNRATWGPPVAITANVWHHIALTWDDAGNRTNIYFDGGAPKGTRTIATSTIPSDRPWVWGNQDVIDNNKPLNGKISECAVYAVELSLVEVSLLASGVVPNQVNTPSYYWRVRDNLAATLGGVDLYTEGAGAFDTLDNPAMNTDPRWGWNLPVAQRMGRRVELIGY